MLGQPSQQDKTSCPNLPPQLPRENLRSATKTRRCPVCGGDHKCRIGDGGLVMCGRTSGPVSGFRYLGQAKDPTWGLYRRDGEQPARPAADDQLPAHAHPAPSCGRKAKKSSRLGAGTDWPYVAREHYAKYLTKPDKDDLASTLGLPVAALDFLEDLGRFRNSKEAGWTFPERDGLGRVVGIKIRYEDGRKKHRAGGRSGLSLVRGWQERSDPVYVVEGASDTLAGTAAGLRVVGRPSNMDGADHLALLFKTLPPGTPIIVLGENDQKPTGLFPGRDGAVYIAGKLAAALDRTVLWALPPDGSKDLRSWLNDRVKPDDPEPSWHAAGAEFAAKIAASEPTNVVPPDQWVLPPGLCRPPPALPEHEMAAIREQADTILRAARETNRLENRRCPRSIVVEAEVIRTGDAVYLDTECGSMACPVCHELHVAQKCSQTCGILAAIRPESLRGNGAPDGHLYWTEIGYLTPSRWKTYQARMRKSARTRGGRASYASVGYFGRLYLVSTDRPHQDSEPVDPKEAARRYVAAAESIPLDRSVKRPFAKASKDWSPPNIRNRTKVFRRVGRTSGGFVETMEAAERIGAVNVQVKDCERRSGRKVPIRIGTLYIPRTLPWVRDDMTKAEINREFFSRVSAEVLGIPFDVDGAPSIIDTLFGNRSDQPSPDEIEAGILQLATKT